MKHLKTFETFETFGVNEELLGLPKLSEVKAKAQEWLSKNKNNPEFQKALQQVKAEYAKLDPATQAKLKSLSKESPEEIKSEVEPELVGESMINEGIDWKNILAKFFKVLGIVTVSAGLITAIWACVTMTISGTGYTSMSGSTAGHMGAVGMVTMLAALVPLCLNIMLTPEDQARA